MRRPKLILLAAIPLLFGCPQSTMVGSGGFAADALKPIRIVVPIKNRTLANQVQNRIRIT